MRRPLALALAFALIVLALAACPTGLLSWSDGPAGHTTTNQRDRLPPREVRIWLTSRSAGGSGWG